MATTDLLSHLKAQEFGLDASNEQKVVDQVLVLLQDSNSEVQNMSVKCLGQLVAGSCRILDATKKVVDLLDDSTASIRDIASLSLKTILLQIPTNSKELPTFVAFLAPTLIKQLQKDSIDLELIDLLSALLTGRYGQVLTSASTSRDLQVQISQVLLSLINNTASVVRKRAISCLSNYASLVYGDLFQNFLQQLVGGLEQKIAILDYDRLLSHLSAIGVLCKASPARIKQDLPKIIKMTLEYVKIDHDELKEQCLATLEIFVDCGVGDCGPLLELGIWGLRYDPNFIDHDMNEDEEMFEE